MRERMPDTTVRLLEAASPVRPRIGFGRRPLHAQFSRPADGRGISEAEVAKACQSRPKIDPFEAKPITRFRCRAASESTPDDLKDAHLTPERCVNAIRGSKKRAERGVGAKAHRGCQQADRRCVKMAVNVASRAAAGAVPAEAPPPKKGRGPDPGKLHLPALCG